MYPYDLDFQYSGDDKLNLDLNERIDLVAFRTCMRICTLRKEEVQNGLRWWKHHTDRNAPCISSICSPMIYLLSLKNILMNAQTRTLRASRWWFCLDTFCGRFDIRRTVIHLFGWWNLVSFPCCPLRYLNEYSLIGNPMMQRIGGLYIGVDTYSIPSFVYLED